MSNEIKLESKLNKTELRNVMNDYKDNEVHCD